ncbi:MAG TPA: glycosyltransferase [Candidatus Omnitrophota bacterium]|nr:glycosyltransferase [Candidatus Omnitrophota bacterium]
MKPIEHFYLNDWLDPEKRTRIFLGIVLAVTTAATCLVSSTLVITPETRFLSLIWVAGFGFLFFNVAYLFLLSVSQPFIRPPVLNEAYVQRFPRIAMVYPVRNEPHGMSERIHYSFSGNKLPNTDLWILSDSSEDFVSYEENLTAKLLKLHPDRVFYRRRERPVERKQGNIAEFLHSHPEYEYLYVCDADGMVPKGTLLKLLRKAECPENKDIAIFQCLIRIAHAATWYSRFERIGAYFAQRFSFTAFQAIFGETISFGHHHLARTDALRQIRLPKGLLSHDNWDTVLLRQMGWRVVFCPDVFAYDEAPANYLEARARARRWAQGTLQGWPLIFKKVGLAARFQAFYGIYLYLSDLVFFVWVILGILAHSEPTGELIHFEIDSIWFGECTNSILKWILLFSIGVVFFHKVTILRTLRDFKDYFYELVMSSLITLNNFLYAPLDILSIPLRKLAWKPMMKDPFAGIDLKSAAASLWSGTVFGLFGLYFCFEQTPYFVWQATPIFLSLILSIPVVYLTAQRIPEKWRNFV